MQDNKKLSSDWQGWVKSIMIVLTMLYIIKQILTFLVLNAAPGSILYIIAEQQRRSENFRRDVLAQVKYVQDNMEKGHLELEERRQHMVDHIDDFQKEFNESLDKKTQKKDASSYEKSSS